jgi:hypothetical protein
MFIGSPRRRRRKHRECPNPEGEELGLERLIATCRDRI